MSNTTHAVWPFEPNWTNRVSETLEWLTDVLRSREGAEQRRSLRYHPKRTLAFSVGVYGDDRTLLDNLLATHGGRPWHLPLWYDVAIARDINIGKFIPCSVGESSRIVQGVLLFVPGKTSFDYRVLKVASVNLSGITLEETPTMPVLKGTKLYPMTLARLAELPELTAVTDEYASADMQFAINEAYGPSDVSQSSAGLSETYLGHGVLTQEANWQQSPQHGSERLIDEIVGEGGSSYHVDVARRPFPSRKFTWFLSGFEGHHTFYRLMQHLRGRAVPVWLPTWTYDLRLVAPTTRTGRTMRVARSGFVLNGGPRPERDHIMIETVDGRRFYRRITSAIMAETDVERIGINIAFGEVIKPDDVLRICFMSLMRLDHDSIEIEHLTDLEGMSEVTLTFRSAPSLRVASGGF
ncbi:hypothetical protein [Paracoccus sp. (in: a-proteobacteria)]|uniref:hypothetical protein n=1 Tax=Paracoccus sp. TaxID=267 RepID=UPI0026DF68C9|nr:hypothetical protein [Paracoccus sp. (in: a-proteobacteria)]MDO5646298.1 hypothetical protein [Paracoccus sp. (in: a-proteobacteria)]